MAGADISPSEKTGANGGNARPAARFQDSYWASTDNDPQSKCQKAGQLVELAQEMLEDARMLLPRTARDEIGPEVTATSKVLGDLFNRFKDLDGQWCDGCGRWRDDPIHAAYCCSSTAEDEHDHIKGALLTGSVYAGMPAPSPKGDTDGT